MAVVATPPSVAVGKRGGELGPQRRRDPSPPPVSSGVKVGTEDSSTEGAFPSAHLPRCHGEASLSHTAGRPGQTDAE